MRAEKKLGLIASGSSSTHTTLLLIPLAGQSRLELRLLAGRDEERVLLGVLDDFFGHYLALEAAERAFNRFALVNSHYCHSFSPLFASDSFCELRNRSI